MENTVKQSRLSRNARAALIVIGSMIILMVTGGSIYGASSMTVVPAAEKFGVTIAETGLYSSFWTLGLIIAAITGGKVLEKVNLNGSAIIGGLVGACGLLLMGFGPNIYVYYFGAALTGFPIAWTGPALLQVSISRWFYKGRATVIGIVGMAESVGTTIISFLTASLVKTGGVSAALLAAACVCFGGNLIAGLFFLKGVPEDYGFQPVGAEKLQPAEGNGPVEKKGLTRAEAFKKPYFWMFLAAMAILNVGYSILYPQMSPYSQYIGYSAVQAATLVSVWSWLKGTSKIVYGLVGDKFGLRFSLLTFMGLAMLGAVAYLFGNSFTVLLIGAVSFGTMGGITGSGTLTVSRMVGPKDFLKMALLPHAANSIGYFFGPVIFKAFFKGTVESYRSMFIFAWVVLLGYMILVFLSLKKENMVETEGTL